MQNIEIKRIALREIEVLKRLGRQTFAETFSDVNSAENMSKYLDEKFSNQKLTAELSNLNSEFYFARINNEVVGYLKVNFGEAQTELKDNRALEIERIYVLKQFHGAKIGQYLYEKATEIAKKSNLDYIWLGVWEENLKALNFYKKNGFVEFDKHIFKLGNDEQTDLLMKLTLEQP
jgi:ribosomal protein S18 acetylase RimI-like enzyme